MKNTKTNFCYITLTILSFNQLTLGSLTRTITPAKVSSMIRSKVITSQKPMLNAAPILFNQTRDLSVAPAPQPAETNVLTPSQSCYNDSHKQSAKLTAFEKLIVILLFADAICIMNKISNYINEFSQKKQDLDNSDDLYLVDQSLYEVCLQIQKDYGITEKILWRVEKPGSNHLPAHAGAQYYPNYDIIMLSSKYKNNSKPELIHIIAHVLERMRQSHQYPGSFFTKTNDNKDLRLETAADAAALDYQYCQYCLLDHLKPNAKYSHCYQPHENKYGYFTSQTGYMTKLDTILYIKRAQEDSALCAAHQNYWFTDLRSGIPLREYLPIVKPSLPAAKSKN